MKSFFNRLDECIDLSSMRKDVAEERLLTEVKDWVKIGDFTNYRHKNQFMLCWGESDNYVSRVTGLSESTVRYSRKRMSDELYNKFGYDFFNVVLDGSEKSLKEARLRFNIVKSNVNVSDYIGKDILDIIKRKGDSLGTIDTSGVSLSDCSEEAKFILKYSKGAIEREARNLDARKLMYLIRILCGEEGTVVNRTYLIKALDKVSGKEED